MIPLPSLTDSAAALGAVVLGIALVVLGSWLGRWTAPITDGTATLTYFRGGRYVQNKYDLPADRWGVGLRSELTFAKWVQGTLTADVTRHAEWGPLNVETRFGLGYGALVTDGTAQVSPVARAGFRIGYDW